MTPHLRIFLTGVLLFVAACASKEKVQAPRKKAVPPIARPSAEEPKVQNPRFPLLTMETLNDQQRPLAEEVLKNFKKAGLGGPFNLLLRSPEMFDALNKLIDYLRTKSTLEKRFVEVAVLIVARNWTAQYIWFAHESIAAKSGLSPKSIDDIKNGRPPTELKPDELAVYRFCYELNRYHAVSDRTFASIRKILNDQQIADLIMQMGTYTAMAMLVNTSEAEITDGSLPPLQPTSKK